MEGSAIVARPINEHDDEGERIEWVGTYHTPPGIEWGGGRMLAHYLIEAYWAYDANIQLWWQRAVGNGQDDWDCSSYGTIAPSVEWVYLGTPRGLSILHRRSDGDWEKGWCLWSEDPDGVTYTPLDMDHED